MSWESTCQDYTTDMPNFLLRSALCCSFFLRHTPEVLNTAQETIKSYLTHAGHGKKTKEWDGRGVHSYTDGMDSPTAHKNKEKMC